MARMDSISVGSAVDDHDQVRLIAQNPSALSGSWFSTSSESMDTGNGASCRLQLTKCSDIAIQYVSSSASTHAVESTEPCL